jgi:hypothetical protein
MYLVLMVGRFGLTSLGKVETGDRLRGRPQDPGAHDKHYGCNVTISVAYVPSFPQCFLGPCL